VRIEPLRHLLVSRAFLDFRFEIVALHTFESEKHVIERAIEMVFADVPGDESATFVISPRQNCVAADAHAGTAWRFLREILALNFVVHNGS
jgi:hypothetical protein